MWQTYKTVYKIASAIRCNHAIYNLQHIPLIGKLFSDSLYGVGRAKLTISLIFSVLGFFASIFKQFIYFAALFFAPVCLINGIGPAEFIETREMHAAEFLWIFISLNIILGAKLQHRLSASYSKVTDTCLLYMRLNPRNYFISRAVSAYIKKIVLLFPAFIGFGLMLGVKLMTLAIFFTGMMACRIFVDGIYACPFDRKIRSKKSLNTAIFIVLTALCLAAAYIPVKAAGTENAPELIRGLVGGASVLGSPIAAGVYIILAAFGVFLTKRYSDYEYLRTEELEEGIAAKQLIANAGGAQAVLKEKDINIETDSRIAHKKGYDYLNAIFMSRYKKMFAKRAAIKALVSFTVISGIGIADLLRGTELTEGMLSRVGLWFFAIYLIAFRERYTLALFNNIDKYMLPYAWYRKPESIIRSYFIRLRSSFRMNATITVPMILGVLISSLLLGIKAKIFLPVIAVILLLTLFYSTHYLTLYYLIQPYSEETKVKSFVYNFFNGIVYMASYIFLQVDNVGLWVLAAVAAIVAAYLLASLVMLKRRAPRSFRLR